MSIANFPYIVIHMISEVEAELKAETHLPVGPLKKQTVIDVIKHMVSQVTGTDAQFLKDMISNGMLGHVIDMCITMSKSKALKLGVNTSKSLLNICLSR